MSEVVGILVHGDNHFIVAGPPPKPLEARALVKQWSLIQIGERAPIPGWEIRTKAFREDLAWAVVVTGDTAPSGAVEILLAEMAARGIEIKRLP